ncbi:hypothetical protein [Paractinoplanes maris]|uniref:hypothetical protein n=1 Tax=Paractinoplanes maris TaxID=1734446 RepID=UPI0020219A6E|nr:hypothetical protein [Actinoplanes maris]
MMAAIGAAIERGRAGDRAGARAELEDLWSKTDDALHRVTIAHFVADLEETVADELMWDERALVVATDLTDERAQQYNKTFQVRAFLPSLHLNLADAHRRLGHSAEAHHHVAAAETELDALPDDDYGRLIHTGLHKIKQALAANSTAPLTP